MKHLEEGKNIIAQNPQKKEEEGIGYIFRQELSKYGFSLMEILKNQEVTLKLQ